MKLESSKVKAGLNERRGVATEASASCKARVETKVATRLRMPEARTASRNNQSTLGQPMSVSVTTSSTGSDKALGTHATTAISAVLSIRLLMIGRNEVRSAAVSA